MKHGRTAVLLAAAALILWKMAFPDAAAQLRERIFPASAGEAAYVDTFRALGRRFFADGEDGELPEPDPAVTELAPAAYLSYRLEEGSSEGELEAAPEEEAPPAVAAFLERQSAFSDYALPENVDYAYVSLPFAYTSPVAGCESSGFGYRLHPILQTVRFHYGTDLAANAGEEIAAFADGVVCFVGSDDSYGRHLKIDHGGGWVSHYCHCSTLCVSEGQRVMRGERVALVGATGLATGPHLHFELTRDGVFLNPEYYLNV